MRLLVDLSSIAKTGLYQGTDTEFGQKVEFNGKTVHVNGWQHGFERFIGYFVSILNQYGLQPHQVILVEDGKNAKARRCAVYPGYKAGREERPEEYNVQFNTMRAEVAKSLRNIGCHFVTQDGVEADDIIGYLAKLLDGDLLILSNDGDMSVLIDERVSLIKDGMLVTNNPLGPFSNQYITLYKAIVGDKSDFIKGAHRFGDTAWLNFLVWAGEPGLAALEGMIKRKELHKLIEDVAEFKPLQCIVDSAAEVYKCYEIAKLHPEWVNTLRQPLQWRAGMVRGRDVVTDERLRSWTQQVRLVTSENYDKALEFFKSKVDESPIFSLDLETSTPQESDDWLRLRGAETKVDVFGSEITGMGLTFGANGQYTFYFSVDHVDTPNITLDQLRHVIEMLPSNKHTVVQNASFELSVIREALGVLCKTGP